MYIDRSNNQLLTPYRNFTQTIDDITASITEYADAKADRAYDLCLSDHGAELDAVTEAFFARFNEVFEEYKSEFDALIYTNFGD